VDVRPVWDVADVSPYQAVVLGSAIRGGRPVPEALTFLRRHRAAEQAVLFRQDQPRASTRQTRRP
jgi:menaquinone-dependent protoporphyrinogen oxidase